MLKTRRSKKKKKTKTSFHTVPKTCSRNLPGFPRRFDASVVSRLFACVPDENAIKSLVAGNSLSGTKSDSEEVSDLGT